MRLKAKAVLFLFAGLSLATMMATAAPPDCTGISDVSDFDGAAVTDMNGLLTTVRIASGLTRPLFVASPPGDLDRLFIVEQNGRIKIWENGSVLAAPFLDIASLIRAAGAGGGNEEGLLGLAFHPNYATNGLFFVYYTTSNGVSSVVARYGLTNAYTANPASGQIVLTMPNESSNHNGGMIAFGPDGYLYVGTGDGGGACDAPNNSQNLNSFLGKMLRLQVDSLPYATTGNPFDGATPGNDEIWAYGLRNPWRFSFDRTSGAIFIGDVGQNQWEEIDCQHQLSVGGENYGWDRYEGDVCPNPSCGSQGSCAISNYTKPAYQYFGAPRSVTGGYVYRGCRMGDLRGTYFFADYITNVITSFRTAVNPNNPCTISAAIDRTADLAPGGGLSITTITSFGEDERGEIYICDRGGEVFKILPNLALMQVSGPNAPILAMGNDWSWENLNATSGHPISSYKVYRSTAGPTGPFTCAHQSAVPTWVGGDPATPGDEQSYFYLVTARNTGGEETRPGNRSDGTPRTVDTASTCP